MDTPAPLRISGIVLDAEVRRATDLGARLADHQPQEDVRVMVDPAGHPFCLWDLAELTD